MIFATYGFETILNGKNDCPYTGRENMERISENIKLFKDDYGSYRFVMYKGRKSVSALQIVKRGDIGQIANVITVKSERQKGYAKQLFNCAKSFFKEIIHSDHLSQDGKIFKEHCK